MDERGRLGEDDRDGIEADLIPGDAGARRVCAGGAHDVLLLYGIDGALGAAELVGGAGFDFDEDDRAAVARDDIDLGVAFIRPVVAGDYGEAGAAEIPMGQVFATPPKRGVGCEDAALAEVARGIAQFPEQLPGVDVPVRSLRTSRCHSMTLPRTR